MLSRQSHTNAISGGRRAGVEAPEDAASAPVRYSPKEFARAFGGLCLLIIGAAIISIEFPGPLASLIAMFAGLVVLVGWPTILTRRLRDAGRSLWPVYALIGIVAFDWLVSMALESGLAGRPDRQAVMDQFLIGSGVLYLVLFALTALAWRLPSIPVVEAAAPDTTPET